MAGVRRCPEGYTIGCAWRGTQLDPVGLNGQRFYASAASLANASPAPSPGPDPTCDYGYRYAGSGVFFSRPLTQVRHGPLGFLLGTHRFYPC